MTSRPAGARERRGARALMLPALALLPLAFFGCRTVVALAPEVRARLEATPRGFLSGPVADLAEPRVLNNKDFVYSVALSPDARRAALTHLGPKLFQLALWALDGAPRLLADVTVNPYQWDVEAAVFSPDGQAVAAVSRDGGARVYAADSGKPLGAYATDEPLVSAAFHPSGRYLAVGSARGLITVLSWPELAFAFEVRAHSAEVRALEFGPDGTLYSGGWDKSIVAFDAVEETAPADAVRVHAERRGGFSVVRGAVDGRVSASFAVDERQPFVLIGTEVAKGAGLDVAQLSETSTVATPMGQMLVRLARGRRLAFKSLEVDGVDLAVCDACLPPGVQGVLGEPFTRRFQLAVDEAASELLLTRKDKAGPATAKPSLRLAIRRRLPFEWFVNDFSLDRSGQRLGVAFSELKAERTREIYEREKKGLREKVSEGNAGAIVDARTGALVRRWAVHEGVVATAGISPDGETLATGGWDRRLWVLGDGAALPVSRELAWSVRRVRFSSDGRLLAVGAWTPQNPLGDQTTKPSALVYEVGYEKAEVRTEAAGR